MNRNDLSAAIILTGLGVFIIRQALRLQYTDEYGPGPGFFPLWIGIGLLLLGACLVVMSLQRKATHTGTPTTWAEMGRAVGIWVGFMVSIALLSAVGFFISFVLLAVFLVFVVNRRPLWLAAMVGLGGAVGFYLLFVIALDVPLPVGPWGF